MINDFLAKIIRKLVTFYYKRTHFCSYSWGVDERNDIHILSEEVFDTYTRIGCRNDPHSLDEQIEEAAERLNRLIRFKSEELSEAESEGHKDD